ncbi:MAG: T9SS type A sorting domain-containing protein [Ignavibacteria bacterium]|nr:T9SS type A sorting domain-containing protein [Ignavibacteria bacterium]
MKIQFGAVVVFLLLCTSAFLHARDVLITENGLSPADVSLNTGDTLKWFNMLDVSVRISCGPGHQGTSSPEGTDPYEAVVQPQSSAIRKLTVAGTYVYKVESGIGIFFGVVSVVAPLPVELTDFVATTIKNEVILDWSTGGEVNNERFEIQRVKVDKKTEYNAAANFETIGMLMGVGNSSNVHNYKYRDRNLESGTYMYRLKQYDYNGNFVYHRLSTEINIGVPLKFRVSQNYPNPFNPSTAVTLDLPESGRLSVILFDISGREVSKIFEGTIDAGYSKISISGSGLNSGIYFCRFDFSSGSSEFSETKKMMLAK